MTDSPSVPSSLTDFDFDAARRQAEAQRRATMDDVWRGANAALATAGTRALRATQRLTHRLARRANAPGHSEMRNVSRNVIGSAG